MFEILTRLRERREQQQTSNSTTFAKLCGKVLDGKIKDDAIESELDKVGKSIDDLEAGMKVLDKRRKLAAAVAEGVKAEAEVKEITPKILAADALLAKAEELHRSTTAPLHGRIGYLEIVAKQAKAAADELEQTAGRIDPDALAGLNEYNEAHERQRASMARIGELTAAIKRKQTTVATLGPQSRAADLHGSEERTSLKADFDSATAELESLQSELSALQGETRRRLETEERDARTALRDPQLI